MRHARFAGALALLVLVAGAGCRTAAPLAPLRDTLPTPASMDAARSTGPDFYPLDPGNRWHYRASLLRRVHHADGTTEVLTDDHFEIATELTCIDTSGGIPYQVERTIESFANGTSGQAWSVYRQDGDGLWATALGVLDPCGQGLSSPGTGDRKLAYPLRPGASWVVREGFFPVVATVEALEVLDLPVGRVPAWRIRLDRPGLYEPERDHSHVWYGRVGFLQLVTHLEDDVVDNGVVTGVIEAEMRQTLDGVQLASPGRFARDGALAQRRPAPGDPR